MAKDEAHGTRHKADGYRIDPAVIDEMDGLMQRIYGAEDPNLRVRLFHEFEDRVRDHGVALVVTAKRERVMMEALEKIAKPSGAYSLDPLERAHNAIEESTRIATAALLAEPSPEEAAREMANVDAPPLHPDEVDRIVSRTLNGLLAETVSASPGLQAIIRERAKQMRRWGKEHDAQHSSDEFWQAICHAINPHWVGSPWYDWDARKLTVEQRHVAAAALIAARIDRDEEASRLNQGAAS